MRALNIAWPSMRSQGVAWLSDGDGWRYRFERWPINLFPDRERCVYVFAAPLGRVLFIGAARDLRDRVFGHERLRDAMNAGASEIWAHSPNQDDPFVFHEVERRLLTTLKPPLNAPAAALDRARAEGP